jgi:hypothetical protein
MAVGEGEPGLAQECVDELWPALDGAEPGADEGRRDLRAAAEAVQQERHPAQRVGDPEQPHGQRAARARVHHWSQFQPYAAGPASRAASSCAI